MVPSHAWDGGGVGERHGAGLPLEEAEFLTHARAVYPDASYELPRFHDFQKFVADFVSAGLGVERARSRSPKRS